MRYPIPILLTLLAVGCNLAPPDTGTLNQSIVDAPGPEQRNDWDAKTNSDPQTTSGQRIGVRYFSCTEQGTYYEGTVCFPLEPGNACNEVDSLVIREGESQTVGGSLTISIPGTGVSLGGSRSTTFTARRDIPIPGRDCHHCWMRVCYPVTIQPLDCRQTGGSRREWTENRITYGDPSYDGRPYCVETNRECGCVPDAGELDAGSGEEDAGAADAGPGEDTREDGGTDAG